MTYLFTSLGSGGRTNSKPSLVQGPIICWSCQSVQLAISSELFLLSFSQLVPLFLSYFGAEVGFNSQFISVLWTHRMARGSM
jgi:hypothetical protein